MHMLSSAAIAGFTGMLLGIVPVLSAVTVRIGVLAPFEDAPR